MTRGPHWLDRWFAHPPEQLCTCGHTLGQHPTDKFRSCSRCVWCDDFREPMNPRRTHDANR